MGLLSKVKNILFVDEEDEEEVVVKKPGSREVREEQPRKPIAQRIEPQRQVEVKSEQHQQQVYQNQYQQMPRQDQYTGQSYSEQQYVQRNQNVEVPRQKQRTSDSQMRHFQNSSNDRSRYEALNDIDMFQNDNSFPFMDDFDEDEFNKVNKRVEVTKPKQTTNVLEYEKKKKIEKRTDYGRIERIEKTEVIERKKFRPSPIISPVYGILNEDYRPEDIKERTYDNLQSNLDFDRVRRKAFGHVDKTNEIEKLEEVPKVVSKPITKEVPKVVSKETPKKTYYEETVTVKFKENDEEKRKKVKTIDRLLEDSADVTIEDIEDINKKVIEPLDDFDEDILEKPVVKTEEERVNDDDTLENDLFDLIDSMYETREEEDY